MVNDGAGLDCEEKQSQARDQKEDLCAVDKFALPGSRAKFFDGCFHSLSVVFGRAEPYASLNLKTYQNLRVLNIDICHHQVDLSLDISLNKSMQLQIYASFSILRTPIAYS